MESLIQKIATFTPQSDKRQLEQWADQAEAEIDRMPNEQGNLYYLILAEFHAVYLRDVQTGYEMLKRVNLQMPVAIDEVKVRRCFFRYLEGAYQFAAEELQEFERSANFSSRKIAVDFFKRVFSRGSQAGKSRRRARNPTKENYEEDYLNALQLQRQKQLKQALQMHNSIFDTYADMDQAIVYEAAKHVMRLSEIQRSKLTKSQMQEFNDIIRNFQSSIENKGYFQQKLNFLFKILDLIDPQNQQDDILVDFQLAKKFIMDSLEKAIIKARDAKTKSRLKETLQALRQDDTDGQQLCYKFLGDKAYNKLYHLSHLVHSNISIKDKKSGRKSKNVQFELEDNNESKPSELKDRLKQTESKWVVNQLDPQFEGSMMTKVNFNSSGSEQRYFYFKEDFKKTWKLFYCPKKEKQSSDHEFYRLKGMKKITVGKKTEALKRKQCQEFDQALCFTLHISGEEKYERNFYVKQEEEFNNWVALFKQLLSSKSTEQSRMKKTRVNI